MKAKKFLALILLVLAISTGTLYAAQPEDALSSQPDDSIYCVLKLGDTAKFLQWVLSDEKVNLVMPLILRSKESNGLMMGVEILTGIVKNMPLKSTAIVVGINKSDVKLRTPFFQMAFSVNPNLLGVLHTIAQGTAKASDIAKLVLGTNPMLSAFADSMLKVESAGNNSYRINNTVYLKADEDEGLVVVSTSREGLDSALKALNDSDARLFTGKARKFTSDDFAFIHMDYQTAAELDQDDLELKKTAKYFDKPLEVEFAFKTLVNKFLVSTGINLREALKKRYADTISSFSNKVKGGNIDIKHTGGKKTPLAAFGTYLDAKSMNESTELKAIWNRIIREGKRRFGLSSGDISDVVSGPFSAVVNDGVNFESFRIPALYISMTGKPGAAQKIYSQLASSQHFAKVQDRVLQIDSSLSPISCLVVDNGDTLGIDFAELTSLADTPELDEPFAELMEREAESAVWVNFAGIRDWLLDDNNRVFTTITPMASFMGYGSYVQAARDVLEAEFSVPSMSIWLEEPGVFQTEFAVKDINPANGIFARLIKIYREFLKQ